VFVAHSMGGLIVLRLLLSRRNLLPRVPLIVFFAVPQAGSEMPELGKVFSTNAGLQSLIPFNKDEFLQSIENDWRALEVQRPHISCGFETMKTARLCRVAPRD
jgi:hypothetical protein